MKNSERLACLCLVLSMGLIPVLATGVRQGGICRGLPGKIDRGVWPASCSNAGAGTMCTAICEMNSRYWYNKTGMPKSTCKTDGHWSPSVHPAHCERQPAQGCLGSPTAPSSAFACGPSSSIGTVCTATCATNYIPAPQGAPRATCRVVAAPERTVSWSAVNGACRIACFGNPQQPSAGGSFECPSPALPGSVCTASCSAGYRPSEAGAPSATCQSNGTYGGVTGACDQIVCSGNPQQPSNGSFACPNPALPGSVCTAQCAAGYRPLEAGAPSATCQTDGTYGTVTGTCDQIECTNSPTSAAGTFPNCNPTSQGGTCNGTCSSGVGTLTATCTDANSWTVNNQCQAVTQAVTQAAVVCTNRPTSAASTFTGCSNPTQLQGTCTGTCTSGVGTLTATCTAANSWTVNNKCQPAAGGKTCQNPKVATLGANAFDNSGAGFTNLDTNTCEDYTYFNALWFSFTPGATATYTLSFCTGTTWDTIVGVTTQCSANPALITCGDDGCGATGGPTSMTFVANAGTPYLIVVGGYGPAEKGPGVMTISQVGGG